MAVYKPHELQMLSGMSEDLIRYWIHFTGYEASEILKQCKLDERRFFTINNMGQTEKIFLKLLAEMRSCSDCKQIKLNAYLLDLLSEISRSTNSTSKNKPILKDKIAPAIDFLNTSYMNDISLDMLAEKCCMSKSYFINVFKEYTGYPPYEYLTNIRIENAKNLLLNTKVKVSSICCAVGIPDQNYFTKIFKRYTNTTPTAYRNFNLWRIFSVEELPENLDDLPQNTSVQRAFVKWLKEGNTIDRAFGAFIYPHDFGNDRNCGNGVGTQSRNGLQ